MSKRQRQQQPTVEILVVDLMLKSAVLRTVAWGELKRYERLRALSDGQWIDVYRQLY